MKCANQGTIPMAEQNPSRLDDLCRHCGHRNGIHSQDNKLCWHVTPGPPATAFCGCKKYVPPAAPAVSALEESQELVPPSNNATLED